MKAMINTVREWISAYGRSLYERSLVITRFLESRMHLVALGWLGLMAPLFFAKLMRPASPIHNLGDALPTIYAYAAILLAPIAGFMLARNAFASEESQEQPQFRFAIFGRWRKLSREDARKSPAFGPVGFMVSLLVGLLLNVGIRTFEYLAAVPAMSKHAPEWGQTLFMSMTADLVIMNFFYMVAFVMALRNIPLFPRMLAFVWGLDIIMQLIIAQRLNAVGGVPESVVGPLLTLLDGNITKVLISAAIWLPYILLSERVNVTYRQRAAIA